VSYAINYDASDVFEEDAEQVEDRVLRQVEAGGKATYQRAINEAKRQADKLVGDPRMVGLGVAILHPLARVRWACECGCEIRVAIRRQPLASRSTIDSKGCSWGHQ
jgi:hypothetical protein